MSRVVMVTGGTGFLGRWAVRDLLDRGFEVHAVGGPGDTVLPDEARGAVFHAANMLDQSVITKLVADIRSTHLLHFAWNSTPGAYWATPDNYSWSAATLSLLRAFREAGGVRFVGAGSCAEYDWSRASVCHEMTTPLVLDAQKPAMPYAVCKAALGKIVQSYAAASGLSAAWGRIFFQYGPHEHPARLVPSIVRALLEGRPAECSHGRQRRSFLSAKDVGGAFAALAASDVSGPVNIAGPQQITIGELANTLGNLLGKPELIRLGVRPAPPDEPPVLVADLTRLTQEVGWSPKDSLESGLADAVAWWRGRSMT